MKYIITSMYPAQGTRPAKLSLREDNGAEHENVAAWPKDWHYSVLTVGNEIEGDLVTSEKNGYTNVSIYKPKTSQNVPRRAMGSNPIQRAMETKTASIQQAQDNKEAAIILSSTFRDATILTVAQYGKEAVLREDLQDTWKKWRGWLLDQYGKDQRKTQTSPTAEGDTINLDDVSF